MTAGSLRARGTIRAARFAPDGSTIVYGAAWQGAPIRLFTARRDSPEAGRIGLPDADIFGINQNGEMAISLGRRFLTTHHSIGTLAVAPSDPNVLYVGSGEGLQRPDLSVGDGIYKSTDGGKKFEYAGLKETQSIARIVIDPRNPEVVYLASPGAEMASGSARARTCSPSLARRATRPPFSVARS